MHHPRTGVAGATTAAPPPSTSVVGVRPTVPFLSRLPILPPRTTYCNHIDHYWNKYKQATTSLTDQALTSVANWLEQEELDEEERRRSNAAASDPTAISSASPLTTTTATAASI